MVILIVVMVDNSYRQMKNKTPTFKARDTKTRVDGHSDFIGNWESITSSPTREEARRMLAMLHGKTHTGVTFRN